MDEKEIRHLAALARIRIADEEIPKIAEKLARVVDYVSLIKDARVPNTESIKAPEAGELRNMMREDGNPHETGIYTESILRNAPARVGDYVKVKKIL